MYPTIKHKDKVSCEIHGTKITDARIKIKEDKSVFICQNLKENSDIHTNKMGYKYIWFIGYDDCLEISYNGVTNFRIHERDDGSPVFMYGDEIEVDGGILTVAGILGDSCLLLDGKEIYGWYTFEEIVAGGGKLKDSEKKVTLPKVDPKKVKQVTEGVYIPQTKEKIHLQVVIAILIVIISCLSYIICLLW